MPLILEILWLLIRILGCYLEALYRKIVPEPLEDLSGKLVLITGASRGIGRELALEFARKGTRLALWDIDKAGNDSTTEQVRNLGVEARAYTCDITKVEQVTEAANQVRADMGEVDILVNNAGIMICKYLTDLSEDEIRKTLEVNTLANFWTVKQFLPAMIERNSGRILTTASMSGLHGGAMLTDYTASKFAVVGFNESLRLELHRLKCTGVKISYVCPMGVNTILLTGVSDRVEFRDRFGSVLRPSEVAHMAVDGVRRNKFRICCPDIMKHSVYMSEVLPSKALQLARDFLDAGYFPVKDGKAE